MSLKDSLKKLQEQEELDKKISLKREVKKELTKLKREKISEKRCIECGEVAKYSIKGSNDWYCKGCAVEYFGDVKHLKKTNIDKGKRTDDDPELFFITGSDNKFREVSQIIPHIKQLKMDLEEIQEIDAKKIIEHKLLEAKKIHKDNVSFIVEDTSLYLDCMKGLPGPLIKWFLQTIGNDGLYELTVKLKNNKAEARTLIGYYSKNKIKYFQGIIKGRIVSPRHTDFGWDAIFIPDGYNKVMGEMGIDEKNSISMRGQAIQRLKEHLIKR
ncbi:MAG: non-canonical purine NTP pyrophosphatase [Candidatus Woesearchaeota archaeon]